MASNVSDMFSFPPESPRYVENALELRDRLPVVLQKIDCLLSTEKGSLLAIPGFGVNVEKYIFESNVNAAYIKNEIDKQIQQYVRTGEDSSLDIRTEVNFYDRENAFAVMCVVDIYIDNKLMSSYAY